MNRKSNWHLISIYFIMRFCKVFKIIVHITE